MSEVTLQLLCVFNYRRLSMTGGGVVCDYATAFSLFRRSWIYTWLMCRGIAIVRTHAAPRVFRSC